MRRVWMLMFCQRFVLMLECETFCAFSFRLPVMSLFAMTVPIACPRERAAKLGGTGRQCQAKPLTGRACPPETAPLERRERGMLTQKIGTIGLAGALIFMGA